MIAIQPARIAKANFAIAALAARSGQCRLVAIVAWAFFGNLCWAQITPQITPLPPVEAEASPNWSLISAPSTASSIIAEDIAPGNRWNPPPVAAPRVDPSVSGSGTEDWHWQALPHNLIYQSYMAGMKEPRLASFWNNDPNLGTIWDIALGGRAGLWRYGNDNPDWPEGWEMDIEGAVFPRLDPFGESTPLLSQDYRFGIPLTYGRGKWQFKLGYYHISSHLGDEYILTEDPDHGAGRINFVRDGIVFGAGYFWTPALRLYGEVGYAPGTTGGAEPIEFQFGFDWAQARNTGMRGGPFLATNANLREEVAYGGNFVVQFGWMWRKYVRGPNFRIGGQYYYGKDDQFEFFQRTTSRIGWGIWYDF